MKSKWKYIVGIIVFIILLSLSVELITAKGSFKLPTKFYVLFGILGLATFGYYKQLFWLRNILLLISLAYLGFYEAGCLCSNGSLETVFMALGAGKMAKIGANLFRISILASVVYFFGNIFCGWVCPKGAVQEFLYKERLSVRVPDKLDYILKKFRYLFLFLIIFYPLFEHKRIFNKIDPFKTVFNFTGTTYILIFMSIILISSIFIYRPFCRYICPLGAFLGIINKLGVFKLRLANTDKTTCACKVKGVCEVKCPAQTIKKKDIAVVNKEYCFSCMECERLCIGNKKLKEKPSP